MIFPIGDDNTGRTQTPYVTYLLIALNVLVFVFAQGLGGNDDFTYAFSTVPAEIVSGEDKVTPDRVERVMTPVGEQQMHVPGLKPTPLTVYLTLLTSMFMHGSIAHIFGNMLFLWIFGDNLESVLGSVRYLAFYLICGLVASLAHVFMNMSGPDALVPSLGASGAISGVLGGYILLFPGNRVKVILLRAITEVPAYVALGLWILLQVVSASGFLGEGAQQGGVAYSAHIGGFIAGLALVKLFAVGRGRSGAAPQRA